MKHRRIIIHKPEQTMSFTPWTGQSSAKSCINMLNMFAVSLLTVSTVATLAFMVLNPGHQAFFR